jgi:hypothetical protein
MEDLLKKVLVIAKQTKLQEGISPDNIDDLKEEDQIKTLTEQDEEEFDTTIDRPEEKEEKEEKPPEIIKPKPGDEEAPEIIKELVGNTEDTYFYMVSVEDDTGEVKDLNIVDQESVTKFSAREHGIDFSNVPEFLFKGIKELAIENIEFGVFDKYLFPYVFEEDEPEEEEDVEPEGDTFDEEAEKDREKMSRESKQDSFSKNYLIEMKITDHQENHFDVYLVDQGLSDTVIDVNGREFTFDADFVSFWKDEEGKLTEEGLRELALDALSSLGEDEYNELVARSVEMKKQSADAVQATQNAQWIRGGPGSIDTDAARGMTEESKVNEEAPIDWECDHCGYQYRQVWSPAQRCPMCKRTDIRRDSNPPSEEDIIYESRVDETDMIYADRLISMMRSKGKSDVEIRKVLHTAGMTEDEIKTALEVAEGCATKYKKKKKEVEENTLNEDVPTEIKIGDVITTADGHTITVKSISISRVHMQEPEAWVEYDYKTAQGETGSESNTVRALIAMLKNIPQTASEDTPIESKANEATMGVDYIKQAKASMKSAVAAYKDKDFELAAKHLEDVADDCNDGAKAAKKMKVAADAKAEKAAEKEKEEEETTEVDEKAAPMCSKCNKAHWPMHKCDSGEKEEVEENLKIGDPVKILDSPAHREHGQKGHIGKTGRVSSIKGDEAWVSIDSEISGQKRGMGYEVPTANVLISDLQKLESKVKESTLDEMKCPECGSELYFEEEDIEGFGCAECGYVSEGVLEACATCDKCNKARWPFKQNADDKVVAHWPWPGSRDGCKCEAKKYESVCESRLSKVLHRGNIEEMTHTIMDMLR